jgi:hypothetical protein
MILKTFEGAGECMIGKWLVRTRASNYQVLPLIRKVARCTEKYEAMYNDTIIGIAQNIQVDGVSEASFETLTKRLFDFCRRFPSLARCIALGELPV